MNDDFRPRIEIHPGEMWQTVEAMLDALRFDDELFQRDAALVHVSRYEPPPGSPFLPRGTPQIIEVRESFLKERLSRVANIVKFDARKKELVPVDPPNDCTRALLQRGHWHGAIVRYLVGITETPIVRPDGSIATDGGYDQDTGFLLLPDNTYTPMPNILSADDIKSAAARLKDVFIDFPYISESARLVPIAAVLTLLGRTAIIGPTPAFLFDASTPGSGKSLQADVVACIATGREAGRQHYPTAKTAVDEELAKVIPSYALAGARILNFDNIDGDGAVFGGAAIEQCLTARDTVSFRVLGQTKKMELPWRTVIMGSGNNIPITRDTERRSLVARLVPQQENPEQRATTTFVHPERAFRLFEWVQRNRVNLVDAALTVLCGHARANRPKYVAEWASFESWTSVVADAMAWAELGDVTLCRTRNAELSPEKQAMSAIVKAWPKLDPASQGLRLRDAIALVYPQEYREKRMRGEQTVPDDFDHLRDAFEYLCPPKRAGAPPDAHALGNILRKYKDAIVGGARFTTSAGLSQGGVAKWRVVPI